MLIKFLNSLGFRVFLPLSVPDSYALNQITLNYPIQRIKSEYLI